MKTIAPKSVKLTLPFKAGELPQISPEEPIFDLVLGTVKIRVEINAKAARKLAVHKGGAALQGQLVHKDGKLCLESAGFQWNEPRPSSDKSELGTPATPAATSTLQSPAVSPVISSVRPIEKLAALVDRVAARRETCNQ